MASPGTDIAFNVARTEGYRAFANKIWNAARFLFMNVDRAAELGITVDPASAIGTSRSSSSGSTSTETADKAAVSAALTTLLNVFESSLRLLSPFMPFLTEELWHALYEGSDRDGKYSNLPWQTYGKVDVFVEYEKTIDIAAERERLTKEITKLEKALASAQRQLSNQAFLDKAPPHVVEGLRKAEAENRLLIEKTRKALDDLAQEGNG
jgi:valyl-tRNA synthetase